MNDEAGLVLVAMVNTTRVAELVNPDQVLLKKLITKTGEFVSAEA